MATYGNNILPEFNTADWTVSSGSISAGVYTAAQWNYCRYTHYITNYNVGDTALISCANCTGRFTLNIYYYSTEDNKAYNNSIEITSSGIAVEIPLQSAKVNSIRFAVYCISAGTISGITVQLALQANTTGSSSVLDSIDTLPIFYSPRKRIGQVSYAFSSAKQLFTVDSLFLKLVPTLDTDNNPDKAWVDITAQIALHPEEYYISSAQTISCFVALYYGTKIISSEFVIFDNLQWKTIILSKKMIAESCTTLDTLQDVPLRLCIYPTGRSSGTIVVDQDRTFIKAFGTVQKAEQNIIVPATIDSNNNYVFTTPSIWPSDIQFQVLYSNNKPKTIYIVSKRYYRTYSSGNWTYYTMWYIHSVDLLGPFTTDEASYSGAVTYRTIINGSTIAKMQLAVITDIRHPYTVQGTGNNQAGYTVYTNNTDILRVQLSTSGVLSVCKLDGTSSVTIASNVVDFDVCQYGCQNLWFQRTYLDTSDIRSFDHTLGFTIFYITATTIKAVMYPARDITTITSASDAFNTAAFGVYDVQLPGQFFNGVGSNTFSKIVASPLHVFNEEGDGGQTYGTTLFGLSLYVNGDSYNNWIMGICEYALREGIVNDNNVAQTVVSYFACVDYEALGINTYWQNSDGSWSITPSTNTSTWWYWESASSDEARPRIDAMGMTAPPTSADSWHASNFFLYTDDVAGAIKLVCPSSNVNPLTASFPSPSLHAQHVGNYNEVVNTFGSYSGDSTAGCIQKVPSGELFELQVAITQYAKWVRICQGLMPKTCLAHDALHIKQSGDTYTYESAGYIRPSGTASGVGRFYTYQDEAVQYTKGKYDTYMIIPNNYKPIMTNAGGYYMFEEVPTSIKGLSTLAILQKVNRATTVTYYNGLNEFAFIGWLPMRTSIGG